MIGLRKMKTDKRLYVLVDETLDPVYGAVQGGHCLINFIRNHPNYPKNETLVYLKTNVDYWKQKLDFLNISYSYFLEPDLNYKLTSLVIENNDKLFKKLHLLK